MKRFKFLVASLWAILILCYGSVAMADPGELGSAEDDALEFLVLFSELKQGFYQAGSERWEYPELRVLAAEEQRNMLVLENLATHYGVEINPYYWGCNDIFWGYEDLEFYCGLVTERPHWDSWEAYVSTAAYFEELGIRELKKALAETDEQPLIDAYTETLDSACIHLLFFASIMHDDPFDYDAQLLDQAGVDQALTQAVAMSSENFVINSGLNDAWYNPETNGQGFFISVFPDLGTVSLAWFTYDEVLPGDDTGVGLGNPGQRWFLAHGPYEGSRATLDVMSFSGGLFDTFAPEPAYEVIGSVILRFEDCTAGTVIYDLPGHSRSGVVPIERVASDNTALCEAIDNAKSSTVDTGDTAKPSSGACYVSEGEAPTTVRHLFDVWGSAGNDVFAVGGAGTILHFDGTSWTPMAWGAGFGFEGVWGSSPTDVYAVGGYTGFMGDDYGLILRYDGSCWREVYSTGEYQFTDVWGSGSDDVFVATSRGGVLHYDGMDWTPMNAGTGNMGYIGGVWGTGANNVFATGSDTVWHYDGNSWQTMATLNAKPLRRIWGSSATDVFAVGSYYTPTGADAVVWHYDGVAWQFMPSDIEGVRWGVWGSSPNNVFAVGQHFTEGYGSSSGLISHYDGTDWKTSLVENTPTLSGVWGSSANDVYAVGGGARNGSCCQGEGTILHFDGNSWKTVMEYGRFK